MGPCPGDGTAPGVTVLSVRHSPVIARVQGQAGKSQLQVRDRVQLWISDPWPRTAWAAKHQALELHQGPSLKADPTGQRGTLAMAFPQHRAGWESLPASPAG